MTSFRIEFNTDNDAFGSVYDDDPALRLQEEVASLLRKIADRVEEGVLTPDYGQFAVMDGNGARVGHAEFIRGDG